MGEDDLFAIMSIQMLNSAQMHATDCRQLSDGNGENKFCVW